MTESTPQNPRGDPDGTALSIEAPDRSPLDKVVEVRIAGADPGEAVEFEATTTDADGIEWRSEATFEADEEGVVDLAEHAPESGTYEEIDPMGWRWSMAAAEEDQLLYGLMDLDPETVTLRASTPEATAQHRITLETVVDGVTKEDIDHEGLVGTVFEPAGDGPHPGVLVLHGAGGRPLWTTAALLARHGFVSVALRYFGDADPIPDGIEEVPLSYFESAAKWLGNREDVAEGGIGVMGRSWGALASLLVGARSERVGAVVSYAGSGVVWDTPSGAPAWVDEEGSPLPSISGQGEPTLCEGQLDEADPDAVQAATIPVEETDGPVLLVSGSEDPVWPATRLSGIAAERLRETDFEDEFEHLNFEDASHFLTPPYLPKVSPAFGGSLEARAGADPVAWSKAIEYLRSGTVRDSGTGGDGA